MSKIVSLLFIICFVFNFQGRILADQMPDDSRFLLEKIEKTNNLAIDYCDISIDIAVQYVDTVLRLSNDISNLELKSRTYAIAAYVYERQGDYKLALEMANTALIISKQTKNEKLIASNYNGVGVMYDYLGDYDNAIKNYQKGYEIRRSIQDTVGMQGSLGNLGLVYHLKGDFKQAQKYLYQSKKMAKLISDTSGYTSAIINLALVFQQQKNYKKALELYEECLELYKQQNGKYDMALAYNNIGSVYMDINELRKGMHYHQLSLKIKNEIGDAPGMVMSFHNLGISLKRLGKLDSALFILKQGEAILDSVPDAASRIEMYNSIASVYFDQNEFSKAKSYLDRAEKIYNEGNKYYKIYEVYQSLALLNAKLNNYKDAYHYSELYWGMLDSIQNNENAKMLQQKELEDEYERKVLADKLEEKKEEEKRAIEKKAEEKTQTIKNYIYLTILLALLLIIFFVYRNYKANKKANIILNERNSIISSQNNEIKKQAHLLQEKNRDITDSIQYAKRLQDAILPEVSELNYALKNYFILFQPKDIVSGDFYWLHADEKLNAKYLFAVVDCTGHGVPGGFVSLVGNNAMQRAVNEFKLNSVNLILDKVSELVESDFEKESEEIRDGMDMSMIAIKEDNSNITLEYAGANNSIWIINTERKEWILNNVKVESPIVLEIKADKQPIGKYEHRKPFKLNTVQLKKGDTIYMFSDGYADQFGGPRGKKFKYSQLQELLISIQHLSMEEQKNHLFQTIENWKSWIDDKNKIQELEQLDDICLAGIKI